MTAMKLKDHQEQAVKHAKEQDATLLAFGIGAGKTAVALHWINPKEKTLIVVPASLKNNWIKEFEIWNSKTKVTDRIKNPTQGATVISYHALGKASHYEWDAVICDEAHLLKNPQAQRTQTARAIMKKAKRKLLLTATPVLNRPEEAKNLASMLNTYVPDDPYEMHHELINSGLMLRVKTNDVVDLKPAEFHELKVELSDTEELEKLTDEVKEIFANHDDPEQPLSAVEFEDRWRDYQAQLVGSIMQIRRHVGIAKLKHSIEQIKNHAIQNPDKPLIIFGHHQSVLETLSETFKAPILYGKTSQKKRHQMVTEFQEGKHHAIICSIQSAGVGLTLTRSHHVIFTEFPWTPAEYDQAYGRAHRMTQTEPVQVIDIVADHAVDKRHYELLTQKRAICDTIIDGNAVETRYTMQKNLIRSIVETNYK